MNKIVIGRVIKPQGIKGEIKIDIPPSDINMIKGAKELYLNNSLYKVITAKCLVNGVFVKLDGVNDRNTAELLRGCEVSIERGKMPKLEEGRYLISDIIGSDIIVNNIEIGNLSDILQYGAADVYVVKGKNGNKDFMFPCLKKVLEKVDIDNKKIYLNCKELEQIAVYED